MHRGTGTVSITRLAGGEVDPEQMARDVKAGLSSEPKDLSPWPKYFYDSKGSRLFEEITELPEYYQTRAELSILREKAGEIVETSGCRELIELGSGSASKTRALLDALVHASNGDLVRYAPLDVSESALRESARMLLEEYPDLEIHGYVGDFERSLDRLLGDPENGLDGSIGRLVIFLGGTIGNFTPGKRREFLREVRAGLRAGDHLLVGVDLVKDHEILKAAYDDSAGITSLFNKNMLVVLNERLGAGFDPHLFDHRAFYNPEQTRIEMWLDSRTEQKVSVPGAGLVASFEEGEGMRTEISTKFTLESATRMLEEAGLTPLCLHTDRQDLFGLALGRAE